jgi:hypothetical protein
MSRAIIFGVIGIFLLMIGVQAVKYSTVTDVVVTVTEKERIVESNGEHTTSKYLVFTENEVFENVDDMIPFFKFNSSDIQGKLHVGETYKLTVWGWRINFLSWYRNILNVQPYDSDTGESLSHS